MRTPVSVRIRPQQVQHCNQFVHIVILVLPREDQMPKMPLTAQVTNNVS